MNVEKMRARKGQTAMEYLVTYGWALLVLLIVLSTLYSFGLFRPSRYMPQECVFQPGFSCDSFILKQVPSGYSLTVKATNGLGFDIRFDDANLTADSLGFAGLRTYSSKACLSSSGVCQVFINGENPQAKVFKPGEQVEFTFLILGNEAAPSVGSLQRARVSLAYKNCNVDPAHKTDRSKCDAGSLHTLAGRLTASIEPG